MIRDVLRMGDPRLLERSREVREVGSPALEALQIGVPLRVVIFGVERNPRYPEAEPVPYTEIVNPVIVPLDDTEEEGWEGCLSVPGLRGVVPRHARIRYTGVDPQGRRIDREATGFHARVVQHECDHLDGILYPMRVRDFSRFGFVDALFADAADAPDE